MVCDDEKWKKLEEKKVKDLNKQNSTNEQQLEVVFFVGKDPAET